MKNYRVTVNGNVYDVSVEEVSGNTASSTQASAAPKPPVAAAQQLAKAPAAQAAPAEGFKVVSPMPGVIVDVKVTKGDNVSKNNVVVVLEAMKMENEIVTPVSGVVSAVNVTKGANVNTGDLLVVIAE